MCKILLNGLQIGTKNTGVQYYTQNLFNEQTKLCPEKFDIRIINAQDVKFPFHNFNKIQRIIYENFFLKNYLNSNKFDLFHSPNYVLPLFLNTPSVLTIHDLITLDFPELCQTESALYFKLWLPLSIKKAVKIIAVSNKVKSDIIRHFNVNEEKIEVVYHGVNPIFKKVENESIIDKVKNKYSLPDKFILFVGNIEPKKNLERLIKAFELVKRTTDITHKLVIVGKKGWKYNTVYDTISSLKLTNEIIFTDYVSETDLAVLYSLSDLFVFPSLYEGFGIPPLEAMACETPVLVSDKGALPEITGGVCLQTNSYDINDMASKIIRLLTDNELRLKTILEGKEWVKNFTLEKTAKETLNVYEKALNIKP